MNQTTSVPITEDLVFVRLLKDLEEPGDGSAVLDRYCTLYPELAAELRDVAEMRRALEATMESEDDDTPPPTHLGDFRIVRAIGRGGMGEIFEAVQEPFGRRVAVKTIRSDRRYRSRLAQARFLREQAVLARLHHTHIVPIHAAGREGPLQYFAMPYIDGASLHDLVLSVRLLYSTPARTPTPSLAELAGGATLGSDAPRVGVGDEPTESLPSKKDDGAPRPGDQAAPALRLSMKYLRSVTKVIAAAAGAMDHAHQAGVVHRDLKPSNLMVDKGEHCWVLDFGLARFRADSEGDRTLPETPDHLAERSIASGILGTPDYMAPEQFAGQADARTDVWGLGVTLFEMLTLRRPFNSTRAIESFDPPRPRSLVENLPRDLEAICLKALAKDPAGRYQSARDLGDDLQRWLRREPVRARPARAARRAVLWSWRNPGWAAAMAAAVLALVAIGMGGFAIGKLKEDAARRDVETARENEQEAEAREALQRRQTHLLKLQSNRFSPHVNGWSADAWDLVRRAARDCPPGDPDLQAQATATLRRLDARRSKTIAGEVFGLAFDPEGRRLLIGVADQRRGPSGHVRIWDGATDQVLESKGAASGVFAFRADGTPLQLTRTEDETALLLWDLSGPRIIRRFEPPVGDGSRVAAVAITPNGSHVGATMSAPGGSGRVVAWDAGSGDRRIDLPMARPMDLAISVEGGLIAAGAEDGQIQVWSFPGGEPVATLRSGRVPINCLTFHRATSGPGDTAGEWLLAAGDAGGNVTIWDIRSKIPRSICRGSIYDIYSVSFSPDGTVLASTGRNQIKLWDVANGRLLLNLNPIRSYLSAVAFSPDGRRLAAGGFTAFGNAGGVDIWDLEDDRGIRTLRGLTGRIDKIAFAPDGQRLACLSQDWRLAVWDRTTGRLLRRLDGPLGFLTDNSDLAFSADGRRLAFATGRQAKLWDLDTGRELGSWDLPPGLCDTLIFRGPDQLILIRQETRDNVPPTFESHPKEHPRVCRVRELVSPDRTVLLREIDDFGWYIRQISASPRGTLFLVQGIAGPRDKFRATHAYELPGGARLGSLPAPLPAGDTGGGFGFDPTGKLIHLDAWVAPKVPPRRLLLEMPTRAMLGEFVESPIALGPGARFFISNADTREGEPRYHLFERGRDTPLLRLSPEDWTGQSDCRFSPDGQTIAWGNLDGTVSVCDLKEVRRRLTEVGLGW